LQPCNTSFRGGNLFGNIIQIRAIVEHSTPSRRLIRARR
jgi:hypothetical protein